MKNRSYTPLVVTLLIIGLANAAAFAWGFWLIAETFRWKSFANSSVTQPTQNVVALSNDRFAVVKNEYGGSISVYQVDAKGSIARLSDVDTDYKTLTPLKRETPYSPRATATTPPQTSTPASLE